MRSDCRSLIAAVDSCIFVRFPPELLNCVVADHCLHTAPVCPLESKSIPNEHPTLTHDEEPVHRIGSATRGELSNIEALQPQSTARAIAMADTDAAMMSPPEGGDDMIVDEVGGDPEGDVSMASGITPGASPIHATTGNMPAEDAFAAIGAAAASSSSAPNGPAAAPGAGTMVTGGSSSSSSAAGGEPSSTGAKLEEFDLKALKQILAQLRKDKDLGPTVAELLNNSSIGGSGGGSSSARQKDSANGRAKAEEEARAVQYQEVKVADKETMESRDSFRGWEHEQVVMEFSSFAVLVLKSKH